MADQPPEDHCLGAYRDKKCRSTHALVGALLSASWWVFFHYLAQQPELTEQHVDDAFFRERHRAEAGMLLYSVGGALGALVLPPIGLAVGGQCGPAVRRPIRVRRRRRLEPAGDAPSRHQAAPADEAAKRTCRGGTGRILDTDAPDWSSWSAAGD